MNTVLTFGTFNIFHHGHLNILKRASSMAGKLLVGVSSDLLSLNKKGRNPVYSEVCRMQTIASLDFVHEVFLEEALELKREYLLKYQVDILLMSDDWKNKFDHFQDLCKVIYLPRTPNISTTQLIKDNLKTLLKI
ncbi:glycerol-3-phosphate cytidyltransferase [Abyssogena phaseoliformis symbiont OG214]|uniref:adenylyltransferase/cytidyltransferase family protein n=1 Tax=Abyssogena phaseoliformis symbiont TaxID=596095 RepID=UPI001916C1AB|nr:adenylyltransferase/cytidyltransferase family protein [Abyssogena phaseoliformis symbiont]MBW5289205.1 Glycerol-3-phosphate cytidylyltransferase [Candidatus Ruthia sp. Apha_13_S6]BBB22766.1 glycerol-3-phosphate cytidyltransferase [Abyssogena phaseoliformis symbiont OG214]